MGEPSGTLTWNGRPRADCLLLEQLALLRLKLIFGPDAIVAQAGQFTQLLRKGRSAPGGRRRFLFVLHQLAILPCCHVDLLSEPAKGPSKIRIELVGVCPAAALY